MEDSWSESISSGGYPGTRGAFFGQRKLIAAVFGSEKTRSRISEKYLGRLQPAVGAFFCSPRASPSAFESRDCFTRAGLAAAQPDSLGAVAEG